MTEGEDGDEARMAEGEGDDGDKFRYIEGESTAGFFVNSGTWFFPFHPSPPATILEDSTPLSSTAGLVLLLRRCSYVVFNPYRWSSLRNVPDPPNGPHPERTPRVLVVDSHTTARSSCSGVFFYIVCALLGDSFEIYSSQARKWTSSSSDSYNVGFIRENTGVSCGTKAFWLREDLPKVVYYDTSNGSVGGINLPDAYVTKVFLKPDVPSDSQLGTLKSQLCFVAATARWWVVWANSDDNAGGSWRCIHQESVPAGRYFPTLSRFQSDKLQVPFWYEGTMVAIWEGSWDDPESLVRRLGMSLPQHVTCTGILPLVHTHLGPLQDFLSNAIS